jgi:hypothetical protein
VFGSDPLSRRPLGTLGAASSAAATVTALNVGVPFYNTGPDLAHQAGLVPRNGNAIPLKVGALWTTRIIPYNNGLGIPFDSRRCHIDGVLTGDGVHSNLADSSFIGSTWTPQNWYVYAADLDGATILDISPTGYAVDPESGYSCKQGDPTRILVGGLAQVAGTICGTAGSQPLATWMDPTIFGFRSDSAAATGLPVAAWGEIAAAARIYLWFWSKNGAKYDFQGVFHAPTAGTSFSLDIGFDGFVPEEAPLPLTMDVANRQYTHSIRSEIGGESDGLHCITALAAASAPVTCDYCMATAFAPY